MRHECADEILAERRKKEDKRKRERMDGWMVRG